DGKTKSYCTPESYKGQSSTLYRNRGDGTFENATKPAGLLDPTAKALGVALIDFNDDGWIDLFVANDTQPNRLYENKKNGTFNDVGVAAGVAFNEAGVARAGMGVDAADYDGSGRQSLVIGNFSNEMMALYTNEGNGLFIDEAPPSTIGRASLLTLTFACFFFDFDLDGRLDIFAANGHVADDVNAVQPRVTYAQPPHLFRNLGKRQFEAVTARVGAAMTRPMVARGAAYGDYDNDGDLDLLVTTNNGPARLLRNDGAPSPPQGGSGRAGGPRNNWLRVQAVGTVSNRDAIGTSVRVTLAGGRPSAWALVKSGSSYCSQSELPLTFGLGRADRVDKIEVKWPNGRTQTLPGTRANQTVTVEELRDSTRSAGQ
ncbi:MAG: CRTAC1 family protein, partial [Vicinamibacterales bacterium]